MFSREIWGRLGESEGLEISGGMRRPGKKKPNHWVKNAMKNGGEERLPQHS